MDSLIIYSSLSERELWRLLIPKSRSTSIIRKEDTRSRRSMAISHMQQACFRLILIFRWKLHPWVRLIKNKSWEIETETSLEMMIWLLMNLLKKSSLEWPNQSLAKKKQKLHQISLNLTSRLMIIYWAQHQHSRIQPMLSILQLKRSNLEFPTQQIPKQAWWVNKTSSWSVSKKLKTLLSKELLPLPNPKHPQVLRPQILPRHLLHWEKLPMRLSLIRLWTTWRIKRPT